MYDVCADDRNVYPVLYECTSGGQPGACRTFVCLECVGRCQRPYDGGIYGQGLCEKPQQKGKIPALASSFHSDAGGYGHRALDGAHVFQRRCHDCRVVYL